MWQKFWDDEHGAVLSAEIVLVMTILVIGTIVGLSEIQHAVANELNDVGDAIGSVNQSYFYTGFSAEKSNEQGGRKSLTVGSAFRDVGDDCDNNQCDLECDRPRPERPKF